MKPTQDFRAPPPIVPTDMDVAVDWRALDAQIDPEVLLQDLCLAIVAVLLAVIAIHLWALPVTGV